MEEELKLIRLEQEFSKGAFRVEWKFRHSEEAEYRGVSLCELRVGQRKTVAREERVERIASCLRVPLN